MKLSDEMGIFIKTMVCVNEYASLQNKFVLPNHLIEALLKSEKVRIKESEHLMLVFETLETTYRFAGRDFEPFTRIITEHANFLKKVQNRLSEELEKVSLYWMSSLTASQERILINQFKQGDLCRKFVENSYVMITMSDLSHMKLDSPESLLLALRNIKLSYSKFRSILFKIEEYNLIKFLDGLHRIQSVDLMLKPITVDLSKMDDTSRRRQSPLALYQLNCLLNRPDLPNKEQEQAPTPSIAPEPAPSITTSQKKILITLWEKRRFPNESEQRFIELLTKIYQKAGKEKFLLDQHLFFLHLDLKQSMSDSDCFMAWEYLISKTTILGELTALIKSHTISLFDEAEIIQSYQNLLQLERTWEGFLVFIREKIAFPGGLQVILRILNLNRSKLQLRKVQLERMIRDYEQIIAYLKDIDEVKLRLKLFNFMKELDPVHLLSVKEFEEQVSESLDLDAMDIPLMPIPLKTIPFKEALLAHPKCAFIREPLERALNEAGVDDKEDFIKYFKTITEGEVLSQAKFMKLIGKEYGFKGIHLLNLTTAIIELIPEIMV